MSSDELMNDENCPSCMNDLIDTCDLCEEPLTGTVNADFYKWEDDDEGGLHKHCVDALHGQIDKARIPIKEFLEKLEPSSKHLPFTPDCIPPRRNGENWRCPCHADFGGAPWE